MPRSLYARLARRYRPESGISRREMLQLTLAGSAGLLLSGLPRFAHGQSTRPAGKRVVVIGAGFAGLACAFELKAAGYDVTVIEARNRVGGRVLSFNDFVKDKNVEGGGELIGSNHPTWVNYAQKFGLEFLDVTEEEELEAPIILQGRRLSAEESGALWEEMDQAFQTMNADAAKVMEDEPWKTPDAAALDKKTTADWVKGLSISEVGKAGVGAQLVADNGAPMERQSYLANLAQVKGGGLEKYWSDSEVYRCKGGNQQLAMKLAAGIGESRVTLKLPVKSVRVTDRNVVVTCVDSRELECDDVVVAVPPTVWNRISFSPELPAGLMPQMGVNVKYLVSLKKRFWKEKGLGPDSLSDGDVSMTWDGTDNQPGDEGVAMVAFSGGEAAAKCRTRKPDERNKAYAEWLEGVYPGYRENYVDSRFMDWPGDQWTMAGYAFPGPGEVTSLGPQLLRGIGNRLHFAGEHTCYKFIGYMEGGLNSGVTVAKRLAVRDGLLKA